MINLLPPDLKTSYRYAHRNVLLTRWVVVLAFGLLGLATLSTAGIVYIHQNAQGYVGQIANAQASLQKQKLGDTQKQVQDISSSLKLAVQVLSKEVLFSKLLQQLAAITPSNAVLTDLNISQTQGAIDITALTTDYNAATQLQVNLADPKNKIFSQADIVTISCTTTTTGDATATRYPCSVTLRALFASNNPFLFINDTGQ